MPDEYTMFILRFWTDIQDLKVVFERNIAEDERSCHRRRPIGYGRREALLKGPTACYVIFGRLPTSEEIGEQRLVAVGPQPDLIFHCGDVGATAYWRVEEVPTDGDTRQNLLPSLLL
jgi:hypothetical protein